MKRRRIRGMPILPPALLHLAELGDVLLGERVSPAMPVPTGKSGAPESGAPSFAMMPSNPCRLLADENDRENAIASIELSQEPPCDLDQRQMIAPTLTPIRTVPPRIPPPIH